MTSYNLITEKSIPHGLALNFVAPLSGQLEEETIEKDLAKLPETIAEATEAWNSIHAVRCSGLAPIFDDGPLDDAVRDGVWRPELQIAMPTVGGLPGSRGKTIVWQNPETKNANNASLDEAASSSADVGSASVKNLIQIHHSEQKW